MFKGITIISDILFMSPLTDQVPRDFDMSFASSPDQGSPFLLVLHVLIPPLQNTLLQIFDVPLLNCFLKLVSPVTSLCTDHCF